MEAKNIVLEIPVFGSICKVYGAAFKDKDSSLIRGSSQNIHIGNSVRLLVIFLPKLRV